MMVLPSEIFLERRKVFQPFSKYMALFSEKSMATQIGPWGHPSERSHNPEGREATMSLEKEYGTLIQRLDKVISTLKSTLSGEEGGEKSVLMACRVIAELVNSPRWLPQVEG